MFLIICINFGRRLFGSLPCIEFCRIWVLFVCLFVWKLYIYIYIYRHKQTSIYIYMNCQWSYPDIIVSHTHFVWHFVTNWSIPTCWFLVCSLNIFLISILTWLPPRNIQFRESNNNFQFFINKELGLHSNLHKWSSPDLSYKEN